MITNWIIADIKNWPIILCGLFYGLLCVFSIVTGLIYMSGKRELNPLELPDKFVNKLKANPDNLKRFIFDAGLLTFVVGIVQGITCYSLIRGYSSIYYYIGVGFTIFSIGSVVTKLKGKINIFPLLKFVAYITILIVLLLPSTKVLFGL